MKNIYSKKIKKDDDNLIGGLADGKNYTEYDEEQLSDGIKVELEHTDDIEIAKEIAKDHLEESKDKKGGKGGKYYDKLDSMEKQIKKEIESSGDIHMRIIESAKKEVKESCSCNNKIAQSFDMAEGIDSGIGTKNLSNDLVGEDYNLDDGGQETEQWKEGIDLVGIYTEPNNLVYVVTLEEYKKSGKAFWADYLGESYDPDSTQVILLNDVPNEVANKLLTQGSSQQVFADGYEAAQEASPFTDRDISLASSYFDLVKIAKPTEEEPWSTHRNVDDYYAENEPDDGDDGELPPWLKKKKKKKNEKKANSYFDLTKIAQYDGDWGDFDSDNDYESTHDYDDLKDLGDREAWEDAQADMRDMNQQVNYDDGEEESYMTIETDKDGDGFVAKKHDTYPSGSVLEGNPRDIIIDFGDTSEELIDKYPGAEVLDSPTSSRFTYEDAMKMPRPDDFDEGLAVEQWEQDEEIRSDWENDTPFGQQLGDGFDDGDY